MEPIGFENLEKLRAKQNEKTIFRKIPSHFTLLLNEINET